MIILYHFQLCPLSRFIRLVLNEKKLQYNLNLENYWLRSKQLSRLNPAMEVPILDDNNFIVNDPIVIYEYLEEKYPEYSLFSNDVNKKSEIRRLVNWFSIRLFNEGMKQILNEKVIQYYTSGRHPNTEIIRKAKLNINHHLRYIQHLLSRNQYLSSDTITYADLAAAAQISVLDYLDYMNWNEMSILKEWYALVKSRPSFRPLLKDRISGFNPPAHYQDLDF
jgi:glutathione S-transferase